MSWKCAKLLRLVLFDAMYFSWEKLYLLPSIYNAKSKCQWISSFACWKRRNEIKIIKAAVITTAMLVFMNYTLHLPHPHSWHWTQPSLNSRLAEQSGHSFMPSDPLLAIAFTRISFGSSSSRLSFFLLLFRFNTCTLRELLRYAVQPLHPSCHASM